MSTDNNFASLSLWPQLTTTCGATLNMIAVAANVKKEKKIRHNLEWGNVSRALVRTSIYLSSTMAANFQSASISPASSSSLTLSVITRISVRMPSFAIRSAPEDSSLT